MTHRARIRLRVNGVEHELDVDTRRLLVEVVREEVGLTGTNMGCLNGDCGVCTVRMNGRIVKSCLLLAGSADGAEITTIEGVAGADGTLHPVQEALWERNGLQCGFCAPGQVFAAIDLLERTAQPSEAQIREAIRGNLCRCTGYQGIVESIARAAELLQGDR